MAPGQTPVFLSYFFQKTGGDSGNSGDTPFFLFLGHFITFWLYLYISSSGDKSGDNGDGVYRLDIVEVRGQT